jgi:hypothetical protein
MAMVVPATASASTQWFYNKKPIPKGETVEVASNSSRLLVSLKLPKQTRAQVACSASGRQAFWNTPQGGQDETRAISFACPEGTTITPILPWGSTLLESEIPLHDRWENVALSLTYDGVDYGTFTGSLETNAGDVDPMRDRERFVKDEPDSYLTFHGGLKKALAGPNGALVWFSEGLHFGGKGSRVTDESGFWELYNANIVSAFTAPEEDDA